jgi:ribonucleoside-diphosphate reductase beta chain
MADPANKWLLAKNVFVFGQCMEGTQFYGLFGMILSLYRQEKLTGIGTMFRYTLRGESNHIEVFRRLLLELAAKSPEVWTDDFREELRELMREAVTLEQRFIADCVPVEGMGLSAEGFSQYIDHIADRRLVACGLEPLHHVAIENPLPWLAELIDVRKEQNFFEGRAAISSAAQASLPPIVRLSG